MGKPKKTKEEVKEKRRLAAQQRRERIKNDPVLYRQSKEKEKERYNQRKRDKKILPICEMSPKNRKRTQKRNRENFRAYYKRQKEKEKLKTIEEEVVVDLDVPDNNITDPLETLSTSLHLNGSSYSLHSKKYCKTVSLHTFSENPNSKKEVNQQKEICPQSTSSQKQKVPLEKIPNSIPTFITSTPRPSSALSSYSTDSLLLLGNIEQLTENKVTSMEREPSLCSTPTSQSSKRNVEKPKRKKISPMLLLRRHVYKTNKEMLYMRKKIEELKREKEKYRKQALRLKYKNTLHAKPKQSHEKENEPKYLHNNNKETHIEKIKEDVQFFLEQDENSRICPGKREYISRKTIKKQKRFLTDTLLNLHTKFLELHTYKISYSSFCKMRPFWVVIPDSR